MTTANAIKKLNKSGFTVEKINRTFQATKEGVRDVIEFFQNGSSEDITCICVRDRGDHHDSQSDYSAGVWADNISRAIRLAR